MDGTLDEHIAAAANAAQIAVSTDVTWRIKREWLNSIPWFAADDFGSARPFGEDAPAIHHSCVRRNWQGPA